MGAEELFILAGVGGAGLITALATFMRGFAVYRATQRSREDIILRDLRRIAGQRNEGGPVGQRVLPYASTRVQVLPAPSPPPPPSPPRSGGVPLPKKELCAHLVRVPVTDALGVELAGICISCDAQVTNEEFIKVGW